MEEVVVGPQCHEVHRLEELVEDPGRSQLPDRLEALVEDPAKKSEVPNRCSNRTPCRMSMSRPSSRRRLHMRTQAQA